MAHILSASTSWALASSSSATVAFGPRLEGAGSVGGPLTVAGALAPGTGTVLVEYALCGRPLDAGDRGVWVGRMRDVASQAALTLTLATRAGAAFSSVTGHAMTASVGGVIYQVEGSQDLATWADVISEVILAQTEGLPAVPTS
jgi:hypothetical protein